VINLTGKRRVHRIAAFLTEEQVKFLDSLSARAKFSGGAKLPKTKIISALIEAIRESKIDVQGVRSQEELKERILKVVNRRGG